MGTNINLSKKNGVPSGTNISIPSVDVDALAFLSTAGIIGETQFKAVNNLVKGLKADGIWSKMKAVYPFVTDNRNLLSYTEDFSNAFWEKIGSSVTANSTTAPNGTTTADTMQEDSSTGSHEVDAQSSMSFGASTQYTASINIKWDVSCTRNVHIRIGNCASSNVGASFDKNGNFVNYTGGANGTLNSYTSTNLGSGWWKFTVTITTTATASTGRGIVVYLLDTTTPSYTGSITQKVYLWGSQMELGSTATTYQPIATTQQAYIASQFKYNLVNPVDSDAAFRLVFNGGWTHSSNGATPNGTNGYADTKLVPSSVIASINNAHISFYSRTNSDSSCDIGVANTGGVVAFQVWPKQAGFRYSRVFSGVLAEATTESTSAYYVNSRLNSANLKAYRNGSMLSNPTLASISNISSSLVLSARNDGGTIGNYSNRQTAFSTIGDGLTDTEAANLYTRVQAYQTSLLRQV